MYSGLGRVYRSMKEHDKALEYFEETLKNLKEALPERHPNFAITYSNIGDVYRWMGDTKKARSFLEKAVDIQTRATCDPVSLAWTYHCLGETYGAMTEYPVALQYHEKARIIREQSLPATHPSLGQTQHCAAKIYEEMKQYKLAYQHAQQAVEIARQKLPAKHPDLLDYAETASEIRRKL